MLYISVSSLVQSFTTEIDRGKNMNLKKCLELACVLAPVFVVINGTILFFEEATIKANKVVLMAAIIIGIATILAFIARVCRQYNPFFPRLQEVYKVYNVVSIFLWTFYTYELLF